jgi:hypothetical protein
MRRASQAAVAAALAAGRAAWTSPGRLAGAAAVAALALLPVLVPACQLERPEPDADGSERRQLEIEDAVHERNGEGQVGDQERQRRDEHARRIGAPAVEDREQQAADRDAQEIEEQDHRVAVDRAADVHREEAVPDHLQRDGDEPGEEERRQHAGDARSRGVRLAAHGRRHRGGR